MSWNYNSIEEHLPKLSILRRNQAQFAQLGSTRQVKVHTSVIGGPKPVIIAGPCAIESREQTLQIARRLKALGVGLMRGGAFKPRTSPYDFQGMEKEGLDILREVKEETGLGIVTEVMDPRLVGLVSEYADMLQIGTRNMYNYPLLKELGKTQVPVLLKRAWSATLEEWLCAAEYIAKEGNMNIVLCERGVRTACHWSYARTILDLNIIEPVQHLTPLPIIVDPSHATGQWKLVPTMAKAGLAAGAHGLLIEVVLSNEQRCQLHCDNDQGITVDELQSLMSSIF